ncbi:MAG: hypothetical protein K2M17_04280, partial [Bacilli bacterium]|nr:hypothetical protein [Bacilli bacterium]
TDVFSENYLNIVTYADGSWKNDQAYYNAANGTIKYYQEEELPIETIKDINGTITSKMQMSSAIIRNNYFAYLDQAIEKVKQEKESLAIDYKEEE